MRDVIEYSEEISGKEAFNIISSIKAGCAPSNLTHTTYRFKLNGYHAYETPLWFVAFYGNVDYFKQLLSQEEVTPVLLDTLMNAALGAENLPNIQYLMTFKENNRIYTLKTLCALNQYISSHQEAAFLAEAFSFYKPDDLKGTIHRCMDSAFEKDNLTTIRFIMTCLHELDGVKYFDFENVSWVTAFYNNFSYFKQLLSNEEVTQSAALLDKLMNTALNDESLPNIQYLMTIKKNNRIYTLKTLCALNTYISSHQEAAFLEKALTFYKPNDLEVAISRCLTSAFKKGDLNTIRFIMRWLGELSAEAVSSFISVDLHNIMLRHNGNKSDFITPIVEALSHIKKLKLTVNMEGVICNILKIAANKNTLEWFNLLRDANLINLPILKSLLHYVAENKIPRFAKYIIDSFPEESERLINISLIDTCCKYGNRLLLEFIEDFTQAHSLYEQYQFHYIEPFQLAAKHGHKNVAYYLLLNHPDVFEYASHHQPDYLNEFIKLYLGSIKERSAEHSSRGTQKKAYLNASDVRFCLKILLHLTHQNYQLDEIANRTFTKKTILFLLNIPEVMNLALADLNTASKNELLKQAAYLGNEEVAVTLLHFPKILDVLKTRGFYQEIDVLCLDLKALANEIKSTDFKSDKTDKVITVNELFNIPQTFFTKGKKETLIRSDKSNAPSAIEQRFTARLSNAAK
jgi:hypothetical protein